MSAPVSDKLALDGGRSLCDAPFPPWPVFATDEIEAVTTVLASGKVNYWTGEECRQFEAEFAAFTGTRHAISLANGTLALELALYALDIGPGDEVIVPARTFIASASCVVARGAVPVVADVDPLSQNLTAETVRAVLTPRTRAIVAVHLAGWPCDMDSLMALARERGLKVVEDCAQAHGATYRGRPVGSLGDAAAFSFCQDKIMTTGGEGGLLVTSDDRLWQKAWAYKDHGKSYDAVFNRPHPPGFRWLHESFGSNFRMTEMQAAIGRLQLRKLPHWLAVRQRNAAILDEGFATVRGLRATRPGTGIGHAYYKYYVFVEPAVLASGWDTARVIEAINAEGVPCLAGSCPEIYREHAFTARGWSPAARLPVAQRLGETSLMFMVHPTLGEAEMSATIGVVVKVMRAATQKVGVGETANVRSQQSSALPRHSGPARNP
ncbi:MAG: aminotransferase [Betaproteobacteria bacterium HGW-Betaproteobacteria-11]|nr:MAG: aminotransferase [Betaproteobacteria bacterium HGW-Betaproteobacteria-11]